MKSAMPEYKVWTAMKQRCLNPKCKSFQNYGARGISICDQWVVSFDAFFRDMGARPKGASIDRIDVNGDYEPGNCRWATATQQSRNQRCHMRSDVGVSFSKRENGWRVFITVSRKVIRIGSFASKEEAIAARASAEKRYWVDGDQPPLTGEIQRNNMSGVRGVCFSRHHKK